MKSSDELYSDQVQTYPVYLTKPEYAALRCAAEEALEGETLDPAYHRLLASALENFTYVDL